MPAKRCLSWTHIIFSFSLPTSADDIAVLVVVVDGAEVVVDDVTPLLAVGVLVLVGVTVLVVIVGVVVGGVEVGVVLVVTEGDVDVDDGTGVVTAVGGVPTRPDRN